MKTKDKNWFKIKYATQNKRILSYFIALLMINEACKLTLKGLNQLKLIMSSEFRPQCIIHIPDPSEKGDRCLLRISDRTCTTLENYFSES